MWKLFQRKPSVRSRPVRTSKPILECLEDRTAPAVLHVGPTESIQTLAQAATVAQNGDDIQIDAGTYTGSGILAVWTQSNLTIEGVGGSVHLDATGLNIPNRKGIFVIDGTNTTVKNIEFSGAHDSAGLDKNWAGIRQEGDTLTVANCYFHNNDDGILTGASATSDIVIEYSQFANNGYGDGYSHNMYIGHVRSFTLEYSYSHDANGGHDVKSRADTNYILYDWLGDTGSGSSSYELTMPNGGTAYVIGNVIRQDPNTGNGTIVDWGSEGASNPSQGVFLVNNTLINDRSAGTFVRLSGSAPSVELINNLFAGAGATTSTVYSGPASVQSNNLVANNPGFVNAAGFDYHLTAGSAAIDAGAAPGAANGVSLTPTMQYVPVASSQPRPVAGTLDIGAYEFAAAAPPAAPSGLAATDYSTTQINLTWTDNSNNETGFQIDRATDSGFTHITRTWTVGANVTSAADTGLSAGTVYYFRVRAVDAAGSSAYANPATTMTRTVAPTGLTASAGAGKVTLSWKAPAGASAYDIYRSTTSGGEGAAPYRTGVTGTSFIDTSVTAGTRYYYEVSAVDAGGESARSGQAAATPQRSLVLAVDAGGAAVAPFIADAYFSGGTTGTTSHAVGTNGVPNVAPQTVYQSWRSGTFTYTLTNLTRGKSYVIQLDFADNTATAAGQNVFNVSINGTAVLSNFDVFAAAGGEYQALAKQFTVKAGTTGRIVLQFTAVTGAARLNGIEVYG